MPTIRNHRRLAARLLLDPCSQPQRVRYLRATGTAWTFTACCQRLRRSGEIRNDSQRLHGCPDCHIPLEEVPLPRRSVGQEAMVNRNPFILADLLPQLLGEPATPCLGGSQLDCAVALCRACLPGGWTLTPVNGRYHLHAWLCGVGLLLAFTASGHHHGTVRIETPTPVADPLRHDPLRPSDAPFWEPDWRQQASVLPQRTLELTGPLQSVLRRFFRTVYCASDHGRLTLWGSIQQEAAAVWRGRSVVPLDGEARELHRLSILSTLAEDERQGYGHILRDWLGDHFALAAAGGD